MRTLSSTLLAAQKAATGIPYVKAVIRPKIGVATRLDFTNIYRGTEPQFLHAVTSPGDGSLIRARIDPTPSPKKLYRQRVTNPGEGSTFSVWTYVADTSSAGTALASAGANVIHFWADTDHMTIKYQESSDYGASWGSIQTLLTAANYVYHFAAAMKPNGDVCLLYFEWDVIKSVKRVSSIWGSPTPWTNALDIVSGITIVYNLDWYVAVSGRTAADLRGVWVCTFGDDEDVPLDTWTSLIEVLLSDNTNIDYRRPSITHDGTLYRLVFIEDYSGGPVQGYYMRPYLSYSVPLLIPFPDKLEFRNYLWREPYPFNTWPVVITSQDDSLAIVKTPTKVFLSNARGVWEAPLSPAPLEVTNDIIDMRQVILPIGDGGRTILELDNTSGKYLDFDSDRLGCELLLSLGYFTTAGPEASASPSFWIEGWEFVSRPAYTSIIIYAYDATALLSNWKARRQISWAKDTWYLNKILTWLLARVGIPLELDSSSSIFYIKPNFTIHPGQSGLQVLKAIFSLSEDVLFFREHIAHLTQTPNTSCYYYLLPQLPGESFWHPFWEGRYRRTAYATNWAQVWGSTTPSIMVDRIQIPDELEYCLDRLEQIHNLNIDTVGAGITVGDALLNKAERKSLGGEIIAPPNCGQELWDKLDIGDFRIQEDWYWVYWVHGIDIHYSVQKGEYTQKLLLGGS